MGGAGKPRITCRDVKARYAVLSLHVTRLFKMCQSVLLWITDGSALGTSVCRSSCLLLLTVPLFSSTRLSVCTSTRVLRTPLWYDLGGVLLWDGLVTLDTLDHSATETGNIMLGEMCGFWWNRQ